MPRCIEYTAEKPIRLRRPCRIALSAGLVPSFRHKRRGIDIRLCYAWQPHIQKCRGMSPHMLHCRPACHGTVRFDCANGAASMPQKLQPNEATRVPEKQGSTAKTAADAQAGVQLMDFTSRRSPVMGTRGMVASSQPLASEVVQDSAPCRIAPYHKSRILTNVFACNPTCRCANCIYRVHMPCLLTQRGISPNPLVGVSLPHCLAGALTMPAQTNPRCLNVAGHSQTAGYQNLCTMALVLNVARHLQRGMQRAAQLLASIPFNNTKLTGGLDVSCRRACAFYKKEAMQPMLQWL